MKLSQIRETLDDASQPLIFYDDDCDGLASFLQVYKYVGDGRGVPVKDSPGVEERYLRMVEESQPDLVVVLDKPYIDEEFLDQIGQRVLWVDHHEPQRVDGDVLYFNPRRDDDGDNRPTSYWLYRALQRHLWIAMVGIVGDWCYPEDLADAFRDLYPGLLPEDVESPEEAIHDTKLGELVRIFNFNLKGTVQETLEAVDVLQRVDGPEEILEQRSQHGEYLYQNYLGLQHAYQDLLEEVSVGDGDVLVFTYPDEGDSFTGELSNELLYRHPEKVILVGRRDKGLYKCSLRSSDIDIAEILDDCLQQVDGSGGGHTHACGCAIAVDDFDTFTNCLEERVADAQ